MNVVVLIGRVTREPEMRYIASTGTPVLSFSLAVDREFSTKDETDFINCELYGKSAENCSNVLTKGFRCGVQGSLRIEQYEKDGQKKTVAKVRVNRVEYLDYKDKKETQSVPQFTPTEYDDTPF